MKRINRNAGQRRRSRDQVVDRAGATQPAKSVRTASYSIGGGLSWAAAGVAVKPMTASYDFLAPSPASLSGFTGPSCMPPSIITWLPVM